MENYDSPEIINVGVGEDISILELAGLIGEIIGWEGDYEFDSTKPDGVMRKLLDVSALSSLGWREPRWTAVITGRARRRKAAGVIVAPSSSAALIAASAAFTAWMHAWDTTTATFPSGPQRCELSSWQRFSTTGTAQWRSGSARRSWRPTRLVPDDWQMPTMDRSAHGR